MSQFPNLLRRSSFAAHDPLITRIYTSTPSSVSKYGDWGLKYPIHRKKGPRHIRFSTLDAGSAIGADWRSGEREARFMQQWGTGKVAWTRDGSNVSKTERNSFFATPSTGAEVQLQAQREAYLPAVENMTEKEFERYLDQVRAQKDGARERTLEGHAEAVQGKRLRREEGDMTMASLAMRGYTHKSDHADEMGRMNGERIAAERSAVLVSRKHPLGGIAYSKPQHVRLPAQHVHPAQTLPGRALDSTGRQGTNAPPVASVGGLTGLQTHDQLTARSRDIPSIQLTDWTQANPDLGRGTYRVARAQLKDHPTVLNLANQALEDRYVGSMGPSRFRPVSRASKPKPFDTFTHDITFDLLEAAVPAVSRGQEQARAPYVPLGSRGYVGRDVPKATLSRQDNFGFTAKYGRPRTERETGAALREMDAEHERQNQQVAARAQKNISDLFARVTKAERPAGQAPRAGAGKGREGAAGQGREQGQRKSWRDARRPSGQ